jgi:sugar (glycoside-pentoside-hexuronide) transporter
MSGPAKLRSRTSPGDGAPSHPVGLGERLAYGFCNFGINLMFGLTGAYLLYFYTDVYHVSPAVVATLFLLARGVDAVFDPLMGLLIDRTDTRFGKHRPYLILLAVPFVLCGVAVFWTPPLAGVAKILYLYVSYTLLGVLYSGVSLPLNSMLPTLTRHPKERTTINALREFMGTSAVVGVGYVALPLVHALGGPSDARGFLLTAAACGAVALVALATAFFKLRERVPPSVSPVVLSTGQSLKATKGNLPWIATMSVNFWFWVGFTSHVQSTIYYAKDVLGRPQMVSPLMLTLAVILVGTALSAPVANRIGKRATGMIGAGVAAVFMIMIPWSHNVAWLLTTNSLANVGLGLIGGLLFAFMADAVDYGEWRSGFRAQGFLFAASSFGVKFGMSIGGALGALLLARSGYQPGAVATPAVVSAINWGFVGVPAATFALMGLSLTLFNFAPAYLTRPAEADGSGAGPALRVPHAL